MGTEKPVMGELPGGMTAVTVTLNISPWWIGLVTEAIQTWDRGR